MEGIIIAVLWATCSLLIMIQYAPYCADMSAGDYFFAGLILIIGGPFFVISKVLESLLDIIMPEGWDSNDGPKM